MSFVMSSLRRLHRFVRRGVFGLFDYFQTSESTVLLILALFVGVLGGLGAVGFRWMIGAIQYHTIGTSGAAILLAVNELSWGYILVLPALGGAVVGPLVYFFAREAKGHGVPEVMEAVALHGGRIRPRLVLVKSLASAVTIATGGSVGREGPIVQVGSAIGSSIGLLLRLPQDRLRVLVGCGAAAGIAATFNAPVAGVLFAIELILGSYAITTLTPLIISSVMATVVCYAFPSITGGNVRAFEIPVSYSLVSAWEIGLYGVLGVVAGLVALTFVTLVYTAEDFFDALPLPPWLKPVVGGLALGGVFLVIQRVLGAIHCFGIGYESIEMAMRGHSELWVLLALLGFKLVCTPLSVGCGLSGGVFAPSLFIGAMTGAIFGVVAGMLFPDHTAPVGAYALVGMAAVVAGSTHAPIMAILMLFELTGDYQIILPLMVCCVIASLLTSRLKRDSIYTQKLSRRGVNLSSGLESTVMETTHVGDIMRARFVTVSADAPFAEVLQHLLDPKTTQIYVVDEEERLAGLITINDLKTVIHESGIEDVLVAADLMRVDFPRLTPSSTLADSVARFGVSLLEELPLVADEEGREGFLVGVVSRRDIFLLYNHEVLRRGTLGLKYVHRGESRTRSDYVEMAPDHEVGVVTVTPALAGKTLRGLDIRRRFNVNVVAIRGRRYDDGGDNDVPDPGRPLQRGETLIVSGTREAIEAFRASSVAGDEDDD